MALKAGAWSETALVTIAKYATTGGTDVQFAALTETIDIDIGDKDIDQIASVAGGRLIKKIPQDITTITFEGYPTDIDSAGGTGVSQMFHGGTWDTTEPMAVTSSLGRDKFRIAVLWTDDTTATGATGTTAATTNSYRIIFAHAYMVSCKPSFTDGVLKFTFSFKCPAFNPNGIALIKEDSGDATALTALTSYNSTNYPPLGTTAYTW